jgi:hypothetical protein
MEEHQSNNGHIKHNPQAVPSPMISHAVRWPYSAFGLTFVE